MIGTVKNVRAGDSIGIYYKGSIYQDTVIVQSDSVNWSGTSEINKVNDTIVVYVIDQYGRRGYDTLIINHFDTPSLKITRPDSGTSYIDFYETMVNYITINGTVQWTDEGDSIRLVLNSEERSETIYILSDTGGGVIGGIEVGWETKVELANYLNTAVFYVLDKFGRYASDTIWIYYYPTPKIEITRPIDNYDTLNRNITISGTVENVRNGDSIGIYVNIEYQDSVVATITDTITICSGVWSGTVSLTGFGDSVMVKLVDQWGREAYDTITINYFDTPTLGITLPSTAIYYETNVRNITVGGTLSDFDYGDSIIINHNGIWDTKIISIRTSFDSVITLGEETNVIVVKGRDQWGREANDTITIKYFPPPEVEITVPIDNDDTYIQTIIIYGTTYRTHSGDTIRLYVNGSYQSDTILVNDSGSWQGTVQLSGIGDSIVAEVINRFNDKGYDTITINYLGPLEIEITQPAYISYDTLNHIVTISGTTRNSKAGDSVYIWTNSILNSETGIVAYNGNWQGTAYVSGIGDSVWVKIIQIYTANDSREAYDTITINYFDTPQIAITNINTGVYYTIPYDTMNNYITIRGTTNWTRAGDTISVYINGVIRSETIYTLTTINGNWDTKIYLSDYLNTVVVQINDGFGRRSEDTRYIYYWPAPEIYITRPEDYHDTLVKVITMIGTVKNVRAGDSISIYYRGITLQETTVVNNDRISWSGTSSLNDVNDTILVIVRDQFNRIDTDVLIVNYFDTPRIQILLPEKNTSYANYYETSVKEITISGTTNWTNYENRIRVIVNGQTQIYSITLYDTGVRGYNVEWVYQNLKLDNNMNTIVVYVTDKFLRRVYDTMYVYYSPPPEIKIITPKNNTDTYAENITITATFANAKINDTIYFYVNETLFDTYIINSLTTPATGLIRVTNYGEKVWCEIKAVTKFGEIRTAYDTIIINQFDTPQINITFPTASDSFDSFYFGSIIIGGATSEAVASSTIYLYLNESPIGEYTITTNNSNWEFNTEIKKLYDDTITENIISVKIVDKWLRENYDTLYIYYYPEPEITIIEPERLNDLYYDTIYSNPIIIKCELKNSYSGDIVNLYKDGIIIDTKYASKYNDVINFTNVSYSSSITKFKVRINEIKFNRIDEDTIIINYLGNPTIKITKPENNTETEVEKIQIKGTVSYLTPGDTIDIFVYSKFTMTQTTINCTTYTTQFSGFVNIYYINDSIVAKLTDKFGRVAYDTINISLKDLKAPIVNIIEPIDTTNIYFTNKDKAVLVVKVSDNQILKQEKIKLNYNGVESVYNIDTGNYEDTFEIEIEITKRREGNYIEFEYNDLYNNYDTDYLYIYYVNQIETALTIPDTEYIISFDTPIINDTITLLTEPVDIAIPIEATPCTIVFRVWNPVMEKYTDTIVLYLPFIKVTKYCYITKIPKNQINSSDTVNFNAIYFSYFDYTLYEFTIYDTAGINLSNEASIYWDTINFIYYYSPEVVKHYKNEFRKINPIYAENFDEKQLELFRLEESTNKWIKEFTYKEQNVIKAKLRHFSVYGVIPAESVNYQEVKNNLEEFMIYPNPFIPNDGNPLTGRNYAGINDGSGIYFSGLMPNTKIEIYDIAGHLVFEYLHTSSTEGFYQWNVRNKNNENVASGIYIVLVKSGEFKKVEKLIILR
ncbi:MAG TPA: T9SS type A sorting domain-containing protein [bacterium]|nr:T9SS type A sorting domain-containing protein [bacterium]